MRALLQRNKNLRGEQLSEEERASYLSDISLAEGYMTVPSDFQPILPTITVEDKLTLYHGGRTIEILTPGHGHTLEQARRSVNLDEFRKLFAGDSRGRNVLFSVYVAGPAVASAFQDASKSE
jgi:hypothetical protein